MQGPAVLLPIPAAYHIDWCIGIGLPFHHIFSIFPSVLYFMASFKGSYMD